MNLRKSCFILCAVIPGILLWSGTSSAASVTGGPTVIGGGTVLSTSQPAIYAIRLTRSAGGEKLNSVDVQINGSGGSPITAADIASINLYFDQNGDGTLTLPPPAPGDKLLGTQTPVNVGAPTTVTSTPAHNLSAGGDWFFVSVLFNPSAAGKSFTVGAPANNIATTLGAADGSIAQGAAVLVNAGPSSSGQVIEVTPAQGLNGVTNASVGSEVQVYSVQLQNTSTTRTAQLGPVPGGVTLTLSDLTAATGLVAADLVSLNLYRNTSATVAGATLVASVSPVNVGASTLIDVSAATGPNRTVPQTPASIYFIVTAQIAAGATPGHALRVGASVNHIDIHETGGGPPLDYTVGSAIVAADANRVVIVAGGGGGGGGGSSSSAAQPIPMMPLPVYGLLALGLLGYGIHSLKNRR